MTQVAQIEDAASKLSVDERAQLAVSLLESLDGTYRWVEDEEVLRRCRELESGEVKGLSEGEFRAACGR